VPPLLGGATARSLLELAAAVPEPTIRVITWNIERGYRLGGVIAELAREVPDIVLLQEVPDGKHGSIMLGRGRQLVAVSVSAVSLKSPSPC
jgi:predicted ATP-grasp superfamily ATP-dependent carboligase